MADDERSQALELGKAIQMRRAEMGMKRKDLAAGAGLSYPYVSEIENGQKEPSSKALRMIAHALELAPASLLDLAGRVGVESEQGSVLVGREGEGPSVWPALESAAARAWGLAAPPSGSGGSLDHWLRETVRNLVRAEMTDWARSELPDVIRAEVERIGDGREST